ncbi:MAG TPA: S1-like domain-containing RNA-binding protein [archaeon]|jgi:exosome complex component RRP4|nr:S1-like domain-containing RNA-binding protein [archaeon]
MKRIVTPGELITDKKKKVGGNIFIKDNCIYSSVLGILNESEDYVSIVPLNGPYVPEVNDAVVCIIKNVTNNGYIIDINSHSDCFLPKSLVTKELKIGQMLFARVKVVDGVDVTELDNINILPIGNILVVPSVKVPRLIGKNDSMLNVLKKYTQSNMLVGRNGWVWCVSKNFSLLEDAINLIITNSQKSNLTNTIEEYLKKNS